VDQLARTVAFVSNSGRLRRPDDLTGERVALDQTRDLVAAKYPTDGPRRDTEFGSDPVLATTVLTTGGEDLVLDVGAGAGRAVVWSRGPIDEAGVALGVVAVDPAVCALARDAHRFRDVRHGGTLADAVDQQSAPVHGQAGVTVRHEDLRCM